MSKKYEFEEGMSEISGMGGNYEQTCRDMLKAGLKYCDAHPNINPKFSRFYGVYGTLKEDNEDAKALDKALTEGAGDFTGAMHQAVIAAILWIRENSWVEYVKMMKEAVGR